jgi:hypothetical protein
MMILIGVLVLYMVAICAITKESSRGEQIQVFTLTLLTILTERFFHHIDPESLSAAASSSSSTILFLNAHYFATTSLEDFFSPSSTLYALLVIYFLVLSCLHNGGTIERFVIWRVDGNDDDEYESLLLDDDEDGDDIVDETTQAQIQQRNTERKRVLLKYFEHAGHIQVVRNNKQPNLMCLSVCPGRFGEMMLLVFFHWRKVNSCILFTTFFG